MKGTAMKRAAPGTVAKWMLDHADSYTKLTCLDWPFGKSGDRAVVTYRGQRTTAARIMCEVAHGPSPPGRYDAAHSCGNKSCINPHHLSWKTRKENEADKIIHGTRRNGEKIKSAKLTKRDVRAIRRLATKQTQQFIADQYGVKFNCIYRIVHRITWRHVT